MEVEAGTWWSTAEPVMLIGFWPSATNSTQARLTNVHVYHNRHPILWPSTILFLYFVVDFVIVVFHIFGATLYFRQLELSWWMIQWIGEWFQAYQWSIWWIGKQYELISEWCHKLVSNARRLVNVTVNWLEIQANWWTIQQISEQLKKISDQFKTIDDQFHKSVSNSSKLIDNTWAIWASRWTIPLIGISL